MAKLPLRSFDRPATLAVLFILIVLIGTPLAAATAWAPSPLEIGGSAANVAVSPDGPRSAPSAETTAAPSEPDDPADTVNLGHCAFTMASIEMESSDYEGLPSGYRPVLNARQRPEVLVMGYACGDVSFLTAGLLFDVPAEAAHPDGANVLVFDAWSADAGLVSVWGRWGVSPIEERHVVLDGNDAGDVHERRVSSDPDFLLTVDAAAPLAAARPAPYVKVRHFTFAWADEVMVIDPVFDMERPDQEMLPGPATASFVSGVFHSPGSLAIDAPFHKTGTGFAAVSESPHVVMRPVMPPQL